RPGVLDEDALHIHPGLTVGPQLEDALAQEGEVALEAGGEEEIELPEGETAARRIPRAPPGRPVERAGDVGEPVHGELRGQSTRSGDGDVVAGMSVLLRGRRARDREQ